MQISTISPSTFDDGKPVTLTGSGFGASTGQVLIGGVAQNVNTWADDEITFTTVRGSQSLGACRVDVILGNPAEVTVALEAAGWGTEIAEGGTITGPAPLAVWMSARHSTSSQWADESAAFRRMACHWDFGYSLAAQSALGNWPHSGTPRWRYIGGPVTGHVFETPGTYTVRCKVGDGVGAGQAQFTVTVLDPDSEYSGTNTICLTMDGSTSDGPAGCAYQNVSGGWPTFVSNRRYLLKRGQDFSSLGIINVPKGLTQTHFGAFGSGAKPLIHSFDTHEGQPTSDEWYADRVVFSDLEAVSNEVGINMMTRYILMNKITSNKGFACVQGALNYYYGLATAEQKARLKFNRYPFIHECECSMEQPNSANYSIGIFFSGVRGLILGGEFTVNNIMGVTGPIQNVDYHGEHGIRVSSLNEGAIQHVYSHHASPNRLDVKWHSGGGHYENGGEVGREPLGVTPVYCVDALHSFNGTHDLPVNQSRWSILGYAKTSSGTNENHAWSVNFAPQNDTLDITNNPYELCEDMIAEFLNQSVTNVVNYRRAFLASGVNITYRNAIATGDGLAFSTNTQISTIDGGAYVGPYYSDVNTGVVDVDHYNGSSLIAVPSLVDPGKPTGAA